MEFLNKKLADDLTKIACKQYEISDNFKQNRLTQIRLNEEFYVGRKIVVPKGRFGVPLPTMAGFVDTLMSKIDDPPILKFGYEDIADLKISRKVSSMWQKDSHPNRANWPLKDRWAKKLACFSGRPIYKIYTESDPKYKHSLEIVDYEDFMFEPMGGGDLENHLFCGQDGIFRTKETVKANAIAGLYDQQQVAKLLSEKNNTSDKKTNDKYQKKQERYQNLGLDLLNNTYVGQDIFCFVEWNMEYEGEWYYLLFDLNTQTWIRAHLLEDVYPTNNLHLKCWVTWATHEDPFNFFSKSPCDDMRPIADSIDTLFNQALDNRYKRNFGQRAYDPNIFPDPSQLNWKPDGLVIAKNKGGQGISQGIYEFKTEEITGTIDLANWLDMYGGRKSGLGPESQGAQDNVDQKVGIYFGNMQQMADRLGLYNKSYREAHLALGLRYAFGLSNHLTETEAVKIIGEEGAEWTELTRGEAKKAPELDIEISGGSAEVMANQAKSQKRENTLLMVGKDPVLRSQVNPQWYLSEVLKNGAYEEAEIKIAVSKDQASLDMMSDASQAIQEILKGKNPKLRRTADTNFIRYIVNYAQDKELKLEEYNALMAYAQAHLSIATDNMARKARMQSIMANTSAPAMERPNLNISENLPIPEPVPGMNPAFSGNQATAMLKGAGLPQ